MKSLIHKSLFLVILLFSGIAFTQNVNSEAQNKFKILPSGQITVANQTFNNFAEYFQSDYFKQTGKRCLVKWRNPENRNSPLLKQSDCSMTKTVIKNEFWPTQTWVIPVVFHNITNKNNQGYLSDKRINDQIAVLNEDYRALAGTLGELGFDTKIQFELVEITRTKNNDWFEDEDEEGYKTALGWDQKKYLNIYTNTAGGYLGYAYLPQENSGDIFDGLVILYEAIGGRDNGYDVYDQGRTVVHEMGHYLGLLHTFEGYECLSGYQLGDLIADTYPEDEEHYGCSDDYTCGDPDNIHNYMNYTDDICMSEFTPEQGNRMVCSLFNYRSQLAHVANEAPHIISTPALTCVAEQLYQYQVIAEDADGDTITYSLTSSPAGMTIDAITGLVTWTPGLAAIGQHTITINAADHYGADTQTFDLIVTNPYSAVVAMFNADTTYGIIPLTVTFNDLSIGNIDNWLWDFGDSTSSSAQNPQHTYNQAGDFSVTLIVTGTDGSDSLTKVDYIHTLEGAVIASFGAYPLSGIAPLQVQYSDSSSGNVTLRLWDFGDDSVSTEINPLHIYQTPGVYTVRLIVNGTVASDTLTRVDYITVLEDFPTAKFGAEPRSGEWPLLVQFADSSLGKIEHWFWDFGDSTMSTQLNPEHVYGKPGLYSISLTVSGPSGADTLRKVDYIEVLEKSPLAYFGATPITGSTPLTVQFSDSSTGVITTWLWSFGDNTTSNDTNPVHEYTAIGQYTVSLQVTGPGGTHIFSRPNYIDVQTPLAISEKEELPDIFRLKQNYPNPFNISTSIVYQLPEKSEVGLAIYDVNGKIVRILEKSSKAAGHYQVVWDGLDANGQPAASGVYIVLIKAGKFQDNIKIILLK